MRLPKVPRVGAWMFVSVLAVAGIAFTYPGGAAELCRDLSTYSQNSQRVEAGIRLQDEIDSRIVLTKQRNELKRQLRWELAQGSTPLITAADLYLAELAVEQDVLEQFRLSMPGVTDTEKTAANLLREVFGFERLTASRQQELLREFETEFHTRYPFRVPTITTSADQQPATAP